MTLLTRGKHPADKDADKDRVDPPETKPRRLRPRRPRRPKIAIGTQVLVLLALVTVALAAAVGFLMQRDGELSGTDVAAQRAMYAAETAAQDLSSYDYRTLESDIKTAANQTTGKLKTDYQRLAQQIVATARQQQAVVNGQTVKSGVVSATPEKVEVLVFLNQSTSKAAAPDAQQRTPNQLRLLMTMEKTAGRWLVSKVDVL
jgi:Mce-associated membrane protein